MLFTVPVEPDADQARDWLLDELAKAEYQTQKPSWFDQAADAFFRWLGSLFQATGTPTDAIAPVLAVLVVAALIIAAFFLFGRPRLRRASAQRTGAVFGVNDSRSAAELRQSAREAHQAGDHSRAVEELFRAIARRLDERGVVQSTPAMTAQEFVHRATPSFAEFGPDLAASARAFDGVRYLGESGTAEQYATLDRLASSLWDAEGSRVVSEAAFR